MEKKHQVFVSSTYKDLTEERKEVIHALLELDCIPGLPTGPGLGVELDEEYVTAMLDHDYRPAETYDADDGSVVDR